MHKAGRRERQRRRCCSSNLNSGTFVRPATSVLRERLDGSEAQTARSVSAHRLKEGSAQAARRTTDQAIQASGSDFRMKVDGIAGRLGMSLVRPSAAGSLLRSGRRTRLFSTDRRRSLDPR